MSNLINLRQRRKSQSRQKAKDLAAENAARFGETKAEKERRKSLETKFNTHLDQHKRDE